MSGRSRSVLFTEQLRNALVNKPDEPHRDRKCSTLAAALEVEGENATFAVNGRQLVNVCDSSLVQWAHVRNLPRSNTERLKTEREFLNNSNTARRLASVNTVPFLSTAFFFGRTVEPFREISSETTQPANDNGPDRQAEAA